MVFNSLTFIIFFVVVLGLYYLPLGWTAHKIILLCASYIFYGVWNPPFVLVLFFTTFVDWLTARQMARTSSDRTRYALLLASLISNLGLLSFFKYGTFFLANFTAAVNSLGISYHAPQSHIVLPIGISFYTFHSLSYTIDVYRKRIKATSSLADFALFVSFFPALVAGPIIRASHFLPQLASRRRATADQFGWGLTLLFIGLFLKVVVADKFLGAGVRPGFAPAANSGTGRGGGGEMAVYTQKFFCFLG